MSATDVLSTCTAYLESSAGHEVYECELPLQHKGEHRAVEFMDSVAERPRGGRPRRQATVTMRWR